MLHIYTGDGKGKTTAAQGLLLRAAGSGMKCGYYSFLKDGSSSEMKILRALDNVKVFEFPKKMKFLWDMKEEEAGELKRFYCNVLKKISEEKLDFLVLDEAMDAVCSGLLDEEFIIGLLDDCEVVLTGRGVCEKLYEAADYITEMKKQRHPFDKGTNARKGIEY